MDNVWDTKDGRRRVRRDPPTVEEAVLAAQGLTDELDEQADIVASLMQIPANDAKSAVSRMGRRKDVEHLTIISRPARGGSGHAAAPRAVVVERRVARRPMQNRAAGR